MFSNEIIYWYFLLHNQFAFTKLLIAKTLPCTNIFLWKMIQPKRIKVYLILFIFLMKSNTLHQKSKRCILIFVAFLKWNSLSWEFKSCKGFIPPNSSRRQILWEVIVWMHMPYWVEIFSRGASLFLILKVHYFLS